MMMHDLHYAIMLSLVGKDSFLYARSAYVTADVSPDNGTYTLHVSIRTNDMKVYESITHYFARSEKNYTVALLTTYPELVQSHHEAAQAPT